jgi:hypothetical protein
MKDMTDTALDALTFGNLPNSPPTSYQGKGLSVKMAAVTSDTIMETFLG